MDAEEVDQFLRDALETGDAALIAKAVEIAARALMEREGGLGGPTEVAKQDVNLLPQIPLRKRIV